MNADMISAIGTSIAALVSVILCYQLILLKKHFKEEHRIKRNIYANDLCRWWVDQVETETGAARQFVERLGIKECEAVCGNESFHLVFPQDTENDKKYRAYMLEKLNICLGESYEKVKIEDNVVKINSSESTKIRALCTRYLNSIETVLSAWRHNLANRDIIEEEFFYLVHLGKNRRLILNYREASGGIEVYPAIYEFIKKIEPKIPLGEDPADG